MSWLSIVLGAAILVIAGVGYLVWYFRWETTQTSGVAFFGRSLKGRRALKRRIQIYSIPVLPVMATLAAIGRNRLTMPYFVFEGVAGPDKVSSPAVFARANAYPPRAGDVFVATQMRCGTTWMQQLVYEIVTRGSATIGEEGPSHLYAISPWIDAINSVSIDDAPAVGQPPTRIIKTHLPARLCPASPVARYIYVARHPVSCFASIVDFNRSMLGPVLPPVATLADWFCSDRMYWLPWPRHVDEWWTRSEQSSSVLFVHFEEMKRDLGAVRDRVAAFLGCPLRPDEAARVLEHCSYRYMQDHEEAFEMAPPTMFSVRGGRFLAGGKVSRDEDISPDVRDRIRAFCREGLRGSSYPVARFYPDLS